MKFNTLKKVDKPFLVAVSILVIGGFFIFSSASLGLFAQQGVDIGKVAFNQGVFGLMGGALAMLFLSGVHYRLYRKYALHILILGLLLTLLVFVPGVGMEHGGARRWIVVAGQSFQPAELLKIAFVIYYAAFLSGIKRKVRRIEFGFVPLFILLAIIGGILLLQPDTDTIVLLATAGIAMLITAGGSWRDVGIFALVGIIVMGLLIFTRPYIMERFDTLLHPEENLQGAGYQLNQSLIAIGSGEMLGRGFGQSVQKFNFLPEPIGDSIFAVAAEEFGFVGSITLLFLYLFFCFRGLKIAIRAPDNFARYLVVGIIVLIVLQSLANIAGMVGLAPLMGTPLLFISHGGTALFLTLAQIGIVLNISKYCKNT